MVSKTKDLFILIFCFLYYPFKRRSFNNKNIKKVLIIQSAKLGDMVCTTPMFRAVKEKYPNCNIFVGGNAINREVLANNLDIDRYIVLSKDFKMDLGQIKKENFDFACITSPSFINLAILCLSGIPIIGVPVVENGWSPYETKTYKLLRILVEKKPHRMGSYAPREYLRLLEPIGIFSEDTKKHLNFSDEADKKIEDLFAKKGINNEDFIVGISPSAGNKIKKWPEDRFAKVADYIYKNHGVKVIIIGGKNDTEEVAGMLSCVDKNTKIINTCGIFNIDELKALISKINMFISVDTGPIYIAEAFGVPTIDITGPMDEKEQPPTGEFNKVVTPKERGGSELHIMNARSYDFKEARRQIESISVKMVSDVFDELFREIKNER